jgi:hypothetical protein
MSIPALIASAIGLIGAAAVAAIGLYAERHRLPDQP